MKLSGGHNTKGYPFGYRRGSMAQNVGAMDRQVRTAIGALAGIGSLAVLGNVVSLPSVLSPFLGVLALIMLGTAATGTCGLYSVLGVDTCPMDAESA
jgi:hypothetical protein